MGQEPKAASVSETIGMALIEHAEKLGDSFENTRALFSEQLGNLQELQKWAIASVQGMQQRVDASIQKLDMERQKFEAERVRLQSAQGNFERNAVQAIHDAVQRQSSEIERQTSQALGKPLREIEQAAGQVSQNVKDTHWLYMVILFLLGLTCGAIASDFATYQKQNAMDDRLDRIEQSIAVPQQSVTTPPAPASSPKKKTK